MFLGKRRATSIEAFWALFVDDSPAWVMGFGDRARRPSGSDEFAGQGMLVTRCGNSVFFRRGADLVRISGTTGEITLAPQWRLWQDLETPQGLQRWELPWPGPALRGGYNGVYGLHELIDCLEGVKGSPRIRDGGRQWLSRWRLH